MRHSYGTIACASLVLLAAACSNQATLPALDTSEMRLAEALVVRSDPVQGFAAPDGIYQGAGEGAIGGMGEMMGAALVYGPVALLLAPVLLPVGAAVGAAKAHSPDEIDASVAAFHSVVGDQKRLTSLDRKFLESLGEDAARQWNCLEAASLTVEDTCSGSQSFARITLRPIFIIGSEGNYDPEIYFFGEISALLSMDGAASNARMGKIVETKWAYEEKLGSFFELAKDDGAILRQKLDDIVERFADRIASDLYVNPRPQDLYQIEVAYGDGFRYHIFTLERDIMRLDPTYKFFDLPTGRVYYTDQPIGRSVSVN